MLSNEETAQFIRKRIAQKKSPEQVNNVLFAVKYFFNLGLPIMAFLAMLCNPSYHNRLYNMYGGEEAHAR